MTNETEVNILLKLKGQLEREMIDLRDTLATKNKAINSLSETIDLLRGWVPETTNNNGKMKYNETAIKEALTEFFVVANNPTKIDEICKVLYDKGVIPAYSPAVRFKVNRVIASMPEIIRLGSNATSKYTIKEVIK